jgi:3-phenylpropionate/trans-cinnamate dioxygenase ferredoxin reductase subunit
MGCEKLRSDLDRLAPGFDIAWGAMKDRIVIVGAGQAAAQCAISLRRDGFAGPLTIVGDEPYPPYQRPPLSKKFLSERPQPDSLYLRPEAFWRDQGVELQLGSAVRSLDPANRRIFLADGTELIYRTLVLATGTRARRISLPGIDLAGVFSLRRISDVERLRPALDAAGRIAIVGGGYIGLEVAAVMRQEGREVILLEAEDRVLKRVTAPQVSAFFDAFHRGRGVDIRLGARIAGIEGKARVAGLRFADGSELAIDVVLLATGAQANDELARAAGVPCLDGILVDPTGQTDVPGVYAIGDCSRFPSRRYGRRLRLESVQNAIDQAKAAAAAILGHPQHYDPVPWFWSDQYEIKLQIAGLHEGYERADTVGDPSAAKFSVEYRRGGRLIGVDAINDARAHMLARRRIADETDSMPPLTG